MFSKQLQTRFLYSLTNTHTPSIEAYSIAQGESQTVVKGVSNYYSFHTMRLDNQLYFSVENDYIVHDISQSRGNRTVRVYKQSCKLFEQLYVHQTERKCHCVCVYIELLLLPLLCKSMCLTRITQIIPVCEYDGNASLINPITKQQQTTCI